jgi:4-hydroxy-tetrahydrodipicolinate reductase
MGARLCALARHDPSLALVGAAERAGDASIGRECAGEGSPRIAQTPSFSGGFHADVVVDFSSDDGALAALALASSCGAALLVGTTGLTRPTLDALRAASRDRAVLVAANTSLGVAVLADLVARAATNLPGYDVSIVEAHHSAKKDAPSGTAKRLAQAARDAGAPLQDDRVLSIRGGDVIGEHTVRFAGPGEYLELTHRATSRDVFARGALRAAKWLHARTAGWFTMEDVLGIGAGRR